MDFAIILEFVYSRLVSETDSDTAVKMSSLTFPLLFCVTEYGCLLPSMPSDATFDTSGISFLCDLNDNIPAPWPNTSQMSASSCKKCMSSLPP